MVALQLKSLRETYSPISPLQKGPHLAIAISTTETRLFSCSKTPSRRNPKSRRLECTTAKKFMKLYLEVRPSTTSGFGKSKRLNIVLRAILGMSR